MSDVEMTSGEAEPPTPSTTLNSEASRLFRVYKTISTMLDKRGYMIPKSMREMTPTDFVQKFGEYPTREALTILVVRLLVKVYFLVVVFLSFTLAYLYLIHFIITGKS